MTKLIMFTRTFGCADQELARHCLNELHVEPIELNVSLDRDAAQELMELVGSLAVPTLMIADDLNQPIDPPRPLELGQRTRNTDRGSMISEPTCDGLRSFLQKHGFVSEHDHSANN